MGRNEILAMTADIVAAHASANEMSQEELLAEIQNVFAKLAMLDGDASISVETVGVSDAPVPFKPAVPLEAAFGADKIFCMICGKGMKTLKRHLNNEHGMKPGQYRKQFGIPSGTPLVCSEYSNRRKEMSKSLNLAERLVKARAARGKNKGADAAAKKAPKTGTGKRGRPSKKVTAA